MTLPALAAAHPMGNSSINHHSMIRVFAGGIAVRTILDFAEIPTMELFSDPRRATEEKAGEWLSRLRLDIDGKRVPLELKDARAEVMAAPAGLPTLHVTLEMVASSSGGGRLTFTDENYPDRVGWKEVVIETDGKTYGTDQSEGLTKYPEQAVDSPPNVVSRSAPLAAAGQAPQFAAAIVFMICLAGLYRFRKEIVR